MVRQYQVAILEMLSEIAFLEGLAAGLSRDSFERDRTVRYAAERSIEIISEASRRLPQSLKDKRPEIDWRAISAVGNFLRHEYHAVSPQIVWNVLCRELAPLKQALIALQVLPEES